MNTFSKLSTLLRAGMRESAQHITDANALRIYRQEIIDAETVLTHRRHHLAAMISSRKQLEKSLQRLRERIAQRETQVGALIAEQRDGDLLQLAAKEIAAFESELIDCQQRHQRICEKIYSEEKRLRNLLQETQQHRRELAVLEAQMSTTGVGAPCVAQRTVCGRLEALQQTKNAIKAALGNSDNMELAMEESFNLLDESPFERQLRSMGADRETQHVAQVMERLRVAGNQPQPG